MYTPGVFVNGREWRGWTLRVNPRTSDKVPGNLSARIADNQIEAMFEAESELYELHVALPGFDIETKVERDENRNSTLREEFVVLAHDSYPSVDGHWKVPLPQAE